MRSAGAFSSETDVKLSPLNVPRTGFVVEKVISESLRTTSLRPPLVVAVRAIVTSLSKGTVMIACPKVRVSGITISTESSPTTSLLYTS